MTGLRFAVIFCVFLIQRATSQTCNCQSELYISIDDLMKALNNGPGIPGLIDSNQNQGSCGCQPTCQGSNQQCGCQPTCQVSNQQCGCQPTCQISNQQCGCQPQQKLVLGQPTFSISGLNLGNQCGCGGQPSVQISQQPSLQISQQPSIQISQSNQQCGCQQSQPSISNPSISFQPISVGQSVSSQSVKPQIKKESVPTTIVPAALLQAPPYGIIFAGDNLLIDGAVQVCGNMPFNSIIELGGIVPSSGSGYVQYSCGDTCSFS